MNRNEVFEKVKDIFRDIFDDETLVIDDSTNANDIEEWDSLEQINILVAIQREFNIKFSIGDVEGLKDVGQTISLVESKLQQ